MRELAFSIGDPSMDLEPPKPVSRVKYPGCLEGFPEPRDCREGVVVRLRPCRPGSMCFQP
jgi:hypothetical protein